MQFRVILRNSPSLTSFLQSVWRGGTDLEIVFWSLYAIQMYARGQFRRNRWPNIPQRYLDRIHTSHPRFDARIREVPYQDILELQRHEDPLTLAGSGSTAAS